MLRTSFVMASWPQAIGLAVVYLSSSVVLAFAFLILALPVLAAIQPSSHNVTLLKLTFYMMAT